MATPDRPIQFHPTVAVACIALLAVALAVVPLMRADAQHVDKKGPSLLRPNGPALMMPVINSAKGRGLFASRGCVLCHSINGVGGNTGPSLDASATAPLVSPFTFAARMWRGAEAMIALQGEDLGYQIDLDGEELGHISAFAYDLNEQKKFTIRDIPGSVLKLMKARDL